MKKILCLSAAFALFAAVGCDDKKSTPPAGGAAGGTKTATPAAGDKPAK